jgi:MFS family permease
LLAVNKVLDTSRVDSLSFTAVITIMIASSLYFYEFLIRVTPSVLTVPLMQEFHLHADTLGLITACFYFAYMPMQIPAGILGDYFGPKKVLVTCMILCSFSTLLFAQSHNAYVLGGARLLTGMASAFAYIGPIILARLLFHPRYLCMIVGGIQTIGCLGAIFGEQVFAHCVNLFSWRPSLLVISLLGFTLALLMLMVLPQQTPPKNDKHKDLFKPIKDLKKIFNKRINWHIAAIGLCLWTPMALFAEMWGVPFLAQKYHLSTYNASSMLTPLWIGAAAGGPFWGWLSLRLKSTKYTLYCASLFSIVGCTALIYFPISKTIIPWFLFCMGAGCSGQCLTFGLISQHNPLNVLGAASGFNNMAVIASGALLQPLAASMLSSGWHGHFINNIPHYSIVEYQGAFVLITLTHIMLLFFILCLQNDYQE